MTPASIENRIREAFQQLYPHHNIVVHGAGDENIVVAVQFKTAYIIGFDCELASDDDGYFHFHPIEHADAATILIAYPED